MVDNSRRSRLPVLGVLGSLLLSLAGIPASFAQGAGGPPAEVCKNCHLEKYDTFIASKHGVKADLRTPANRGSCALCHGDGTAHVKAGGGKGVGGMVRLSTKVVAADAINKTCLACHQGDPQRLHWQSSVHASQDTACTSCHKLHAAQDDVRNKITQPEVCFTCHRDKRIQVNKPSRHPVLEGKVSCADCHNVHGNNPKQMIKASVVETCWQCHLEKRGPFVHNHQPVTEDCTICHQPHGSTISPMLKSRPPYLCQDCHGTTGHRNASAGLPTARSSSTSVVNTVGRGCLNCHTNIHGSNSSQNSVTVNRFRR